MPIKPKTTWREMANERHAAMSNVAEALRCSTPKANTPEAIQRHAKALAYVEGYLADYNWLQRD